MKEMKTLTDLEEEYPVAENMLGEPKIVIVKHLRAEAIKEIKTFQSIKKHGLCEKEGSCTICDRNRVTGFTFTEDVVGYIKWKNNLTAEDLK